MQDDDADDGLGRAAECARDRHVPMVTDDEAAEGGRDQDQPPGAHTHEPQAGERDAGGQPHDGLVEDGVAELPGLRGDEQGRREQQQFADVMPAVAGHGLARPRGRGEGAGTGALGQWGTGAEWESIPGADGWRQ